MRDIIKQIVRPHAVDAWLVLNPTVYYKKGEPYGLIAESHKVDDCIYIVSTTRNTEEPFTKNMIRDIIRLYKQHSVCLITDYEPAQEKIRSFLTRYGCTYKTIDGVLYSYHFIPKD